MKHRENQLRLVGRAGHDPATYGLKGRANEPDSPSDSTDRDDRDPTVVQVEAVVEVTNGLSKGLRGVVEARAEIVFGGKPMWRVRLEAPFFVRTIRTDYLRRIG